MVHIFISYAKKDTRDLALKLDDEFDALLGITSWVDRELGGVAGQNKSSVKSGIVMS